MNIMRSTGWLSATLFALGLAVTSPAHAADYAPLDCTKADSAAQRTICSDYGLGQSEARIATLYELTTSLVAMGQRGNIQDDQRAFIRERDACNSDIRCIQRAYDKRGKQLDAVMARIKERGPF
jgi:uncharacterized protein